MKTLAEVNEEMKNCTACPLHTGRTQVVPGSGNPEADIMFIGEGPGAKEDEKGLPFVGAAGKFLEEMLMSINLKREDVYITNIVKCRPPGNRDPLPLEKDTCTKAHLDRQIDAIKPKIIVTLGRHAMSYFLGTTLKISRDHGTLKKSNGRYFFVLYHPAAALYNGGMRSTLLEDFSKLPSAVKAVKKDLTQIT